YVEGKMDRVADLVAELVQLKVDVLVANASTPVRAAKEATKTIPIVMVTTQDPVETGLVERVARPGGNITGLTRLTRDLGGKRLELLKEVVPKSPRVAILYSNDESGASIALKEYQTAANALKLELQPLTVPGHDPQLSGVFRDA